MKFYRKVLFIITIILFVYIIWNFLKKRISKPSSYEAFNTVSDPAAVTEVASITNSNSIHIQSIPAKVADQPLIEYVIKGAANSAISGNYASTDMIKYVLSRGCRFLDFELFLMNNEKGKPTVIVSYSSDPSFKTVDTNNRLSLDDALSAAITYGYAPPSPNPNDPLFIQLRVKSTDPTIYQQIAKIVDFQLKTSLYTGKVTNQTTLSKLLGKTILIMDKTTNRNYATLATCKDNDKTCYDLTKYINMESGSDTLFTQKYGEILSQPNIPINILDKCDRCTDIKNMRVVMPDNTAKNPTLNSFVVDHASQIVPYRFYLLDTGLKNYETFFDDNKFAFVPLAYTITYFKKQNP